MSAAGRRDLVVFACAGCGAELTAPLSQACLPVHARQKYGDGIQMPVLMKPGTFAVDPEPWGPPWRRWEDFAPGEAEARGVYAPVHALSEGAPGAVVIAPGDVRGTRVMPEMSGGACCGLDGRDGPNMACLACGLTVATRIDDCSLWQAVWLAPGAVRRARDDAPAAPLPWDELLAEAEPTPPMEPIATWGGRSGSDYLWSWSPQWEAAAGQALAHLLAASGGQPLRVHDGPAADLLQRGLDALLPAGPPARNAVLAGPGHPPGPAADILLVPAHPQTGHPWTPAGPDASAYLVSLPFGIWLWMTTPPPAAPPHGIPIGITRDEPAPSLPGTPPRADRGTFQHVLSRLPAVRSPWLRQVLEDSMRHRPADIF